VNSLPLFPLNLVLYPSERLPLHIFEERYKELMAIVLREDREFGIVWVRDGVLSSVGTTVRVEKVIERYSDGRLDVLVEGVSRFRIVSVTDDLATYYVAQTEPLPEGPPGDEVHGLQQRLIAQHMRLLELSSRTPRPSLYQTSSYLSYLLGHNCGLTLDQKQDLLALSSEADRLHYLARHLEQLIPQVEHKEEVRRKVQSNGHFRDFPL